MRRLSRTFSILLAEAVHKDLEARGHKVRVVRALGNAYGLTIDYDAKGRMARLSGVADPRGGGRAAGY